MGQRIQVLFHSIAVQARREISRIRCRCKTKDEKNSECRDIPCGSEREQIKLVFICVDCENEKERKPSPSQAFSFHVGHTPILTSPKLNGCNTWAARFYSFAFIHGGSGAKTTLSTKKSILPPVLHAGKQPLVSFFVGVTTNGQKQQQFGRGIGGSSSSLSSGTSWH